MKIGAGMSTFMKTVVYGQTLINETINIRVQGVRIQEVSSETLGPQAPRSLGPSSVWLIP
jgi:hypothetical protein